MVKKLILVVVLITLVLVALDFLLACYRYRITEPLGVGVADNGREITLYEGQTLVLTLESNSTTGYSWELGEFDKAILEQTSHVYLPYAHPPGQVGVGGEEIWYFQARSSGRTTLQLEYVRPWVSIKPARTFTVQVTVRPADFLLLKKILR